MARSDSPEPATAAPAAGARPQPARSAVLGGMAFLDGVASGWNCWELAGWFDDHLVAPGRMHDPPATVNEERLGTIAIDPRRASRAEQAAPIAQLPALLAAARARVVEVLRAFVAAASDDRFLNAAIYAGRVARSSLPPGSADSTAWIARPQETDRLSDIVLSLFAADILSNREFYEANLCVCEVCGRASFEPDITTRARCIEHVTLAGTGSGFFRRP